jgi:hypothetical protein
VLATAVAAAIVYLTRVRRISSGYEMLYETALQTQQYLDGELLREHQDLVVVGNTDRLPTVVRFSNALEAPTLNIRLDAPAPFTLWVLPRGTPHPEGRFEVPSGDPGFDARFSIRTDDPRYVRALLQECLLPSLKGLCRSRVNFFAMTRGHMEFSEQCLTSPYVELHVRRVLALIRRLTRVMEGLPGAEGVRIVPWRKDRALLLHGAFAAGILAIAVLFTSTTGARQGETGADAVQKAYLPVPASDAALIPDAGRYRLATPADFDLDSRSWVRDQGGTDGPVLTGSFGETASGSGRVYVLVGKDRAKRIIVIAGGRKIYDAVFANVAAVVKVRAASLRGIAWRSRDVPEVVGDGLLLVQQATEPASGVVLFFRNGSAIAAVPNDYKDVPLS